MIQITGTERRSGRMTEKARDAKAHVKYEWGRGRPDAPPRYLNGGSGGTQVKVYVQFYLLMAEPSVNIVDLNKRISILPV